MPPSLSFTYFVIGVGALLATPITYVVFLRLHAWRYGHWTDYRKPTFLNRLAYGTDDLNNTAASLVILVGGFGVAALIFSAATYALSRPFPSIVDHATGLVIVAIAIALKREVLAAHVSRIRRLFA